MTRRKLSDVLREEVAMEEPMSETPLETNADAETSAETETTGASRRLTKADLEVKLQELETDAIAQAEAFAQEKASLEAKLSSQAEQITELRRYLDQANNLKVELDTANAELAKLKSKASKTALAAKAPVTPVKDQLPSTLQRPVGPSKTPDAFNKDIHLF